MCLPMGSIIIFIIVGLSTFANIAAWNKPGLETNFKETYSKTPLEIQRKAATEVIARLLPNHWQLFEIQLIKDLPLNTFQLMKDNNDTTVRIIASSGVTACKGFYHYFKLYLNGHVSWSGNQIPEIPNILPNIRMQSQSASIFIYHQNVCTWSYSYVWWTWKDWQKHLDWMAFMGISLTLAPVQEAIWTRVYRNIGLTDDEINDHFAGPGFQAWQRMGNIRGWAGPAPYTYKAQQLALQKKIIEAERNLGMTVAVPAFAGHVPVGLRRLYPNATLTAVECWNHFPADSCCPLFIEPEQDLFQIIGAAFLREVIHEYGTDHIYFSDPFNENKPRKAESAYLAQTSRNIYETMKQVDSEAVWLLQGWMFVKNEFWSQKLIEAFLTAVPIGRMLVLDLQSEILPQYERTKSYYGQPFLWCMLHNFGGTLGIQGSAQIVNSRISLTRKMPNSTMIGVGITMEGINQNDVMYEFALDRGWSFLDFDEKKWFDRFSVGRYGQEDLKVANANDLLRASVYAYKGLEKLHGKYTICIRPSTNLRPWSWYNHSILESAWTSLLQVNRSLHTSPLYRHDLVDITRQFLQNKADQIYVNIVASYKAKNLTILQQLSNDMIEIFIDLEKILKTSRQFLLGNWINAAKMLATNDLEELIYEFNARNQITTWGPKAQINDYANKQWSGLMIDYYMPRWRMFFKELELSLAFNRTFSDVKFRKNVFRDIENPFTYDRKIYTDQPDGCSVGISKEIHAKWTSYKNEKNLIKHVPVVP